MRRLQRFDDGGFTLVEVVVAMMIFAMIATGFLYVMTSGMTLSRDTRARIVAANLAAQQVDIERSRASVFDIVNSTRDVELNGDTFHVAVSTSWAFSSGVSATCQAGDTTGSIRYKEFTVEVTWDNMSASAQPVYSDSTLTPRTKINDPTLGTVLVGVIDASGSGVSGATVNLTTSSSTVASTTTDSDGCAYLLKVPAGSFTASVSKSGYVNEQQLSTPTATVEVTAGGASRLSFAYDRAVTFTTTYAGGSATLPTNLTTSLVSTYGSSLFTSTTTANPKSLAAYPISSGYSLLAGPYAETPENAATSCLATDPGQWTATSTTSGVRPDPVAGLRGTTVTAAVAMGTVKLSSPNGSGSYVTAVYVGGGDGDPGCAAATTTVGSTYMTYTFGTVLSGSASPTLALPFGTWELYRGASSGAKTTKITSGISVTSNGSVTSGRITLDPRTTS
ncbi:carboxypeptidase regulatory-like domain-containing protein [Tessaracoccus lacteus]|uniref:Carboxypeptidase regulatory-like domain-containing protein n=1 Tax=Tessaracoccus lacteus TaxID=3041766 RepID=A0ABY8PZ25_9ACTN|nr:carboxypeptidase regulatory-like domain-containing protein [Tessaracoccus sp. T21]WGT47437.1 carboxypeptidase regulatory-like domain-containing protein [Tessaracoccus sp. T21]